MYMISMSLIIAFSVFNIVKFANDACEGGDSKVRQMTHVKWWLFLVFTRTTNVFTIILFRMELATQKPSVKIKVEKQVDPARKVN